MTSTPKTPQPPEHLSAEAKSYWREVVKHYDLEPHHLKLLRAACEQWDRATAARKEITKDGLIFRDRFQQPREHPAISVERQAHLAFCRLTREMGLDIEPPSASRGHLPTGYH